MRLLSVTYRSRSRKALCGPWFMTYLCSRGTTGRMWDLSTNWKNNSGKCCRNTATGFVAVNVFIVVVAVRTLLPRWSGGRDITRNIIVPKPSNRLGSPQSSVTGYDKAWTNNKIMFTVLHTILCSTLVSIPGFSGWLVHKRSHRAPSLLLWRGLHWASRASNERNSRSKSCHCPQRSAQPSTISCTRLKRKVALTISGSKYGLNLTME